LRQARIALDALDAAVDAIATQRLEISGPVRISSSAAFGRDHLLPALPGLLTRYPQLAVEVDFDDRVVDLVGVATTWPFAAAILPTPRWWRAPSAICAWYW
jgi:DNA-binding transcriptional LysR family regulator